MNTKAGSKKSTSLQKETTRRHVVLTLIPVAALLFIFAVCMFLKYLLNTFVIGQLVAFLFGFVVEPDSYYIVRHVLFIDKIVLDFLEFLIPTTIFGLDLSRALLIVVGIGMRLFAMRMAADVLDYSKTFNFKETFETWKVDKHLIYDETGITPLYDKKIKDIKNRKLKQAKKGRMDMFKVLKEVREHFDFMKRHLAFLSIDIVDSIGMKKGENQSEVELDFLEYKNLVQKAFNDNAYLKAAWTPDGVMCCFKASDNAVRAAKQVISDLNAFNRYSKKIKQDFAVRCGINIGNVTYDRSMPVEEMCDSVIDIAGHLQKNAPSGGIYVSEAVHLDVSDKEGITSTGEFIDGTEVYIYK